VITDKIRTMRVCQSAQQLPALLQHIFVLRRLTDCYLAAAAGSKATDNRYANCCWHCLFTF